MINQMANTNGYPFVTQSQIVARLAEEPSFRLSCLAILVGRQTSDEVEEKATKYTNKRGLRCSESVWMVSLLAKFINSPETVTGEDNDRLARTLPIYRKQLAAHFRNVDLANQPELAEKARQFGL